MYKTVTALFILFIPCALFASARLQYVPLIPVEQTSKLTLDVKESLPILNLTTKASQVFKFDIVVKSRAPTKGGLGLPADMKLTIKDMFVLVNVNGKEVAFDPRKENGDPQLTQLAQLIDRPINLSVDSHGGLEEGAGTFDRLLKEFPALKQIPLEPLFNDMVSSLFALYDEELTLGAKVEMQSSPGPAFGFPAFVTYEITQISDKEVSASIAGKIEPKKIPLDKTVKLDNGRPQRVEMVLSGTVNGVATWQRNNAMLYSLNSEYRYEAQLKAGSKQWTMEMTVSQAISTVPL